MSSQSLLTRPFVQTSEDSTPVEASDQLLERLLGDRWSDHAFALEELRNFGATHSVHGLREELADEIAKACLARLSKEMLEVIDAPTNAGLATQEYRAARAIAAIPDPLLVREALGELVARQLFAIFDHTTAANLSDHLNGQHSIDPTPIGIRLSKFYHVELQREYPVIAKLLSANQSTGSTLNSFEQHFMLGFSSLGAHPEAHQSERATRAQARRKLA